MEKYTGRSCKWQGSSFIYCFFLFFCLFLLNLWLFHSAAGKSPNSHIVLPPPLDPCIDKPSCSSCQLLLHWKWKRVPLGLVSACVSHATFSSRVFKCAMVRRRVLYVSISAFSPARDAAASYRVNKLVHQSLRHIRLADDALLVVLTYGAAQLVIVHSGSILSESPQSGDVSRVFNFKNT